MKTYRKPSISKLVNRFDNELKNLLLEDLKTVRTAKNQLLNTIKQSISTTNGLSAA
ncbi:hypothetical protein KHS38_06955 [Mucilaginibacter sp. Bleaf8]|uniref:hypothetical protein n=1 Tax=Mucilaginibacter sp. Bleaf8 TaxID=2834430 RepID=UPI001BCB62E4|nr:hypothetical protein [Mucilaginibacter sp. Bleaf8]MBS7564140.1 hypothetical protein [Mucilaginibacter sp. Bleaf8]